MSDKKDDFPEIILLLEPSGWPFLERWNSQERIVKNLLKDRRSGKAAYQSMSTVVLLNGAGFAHEARKILQEIYEGSETEMLLRYTLTRSSKGCN